MEESTITVNLRTGDSNFMEIVHFIGETQKGTYTKNAPVEVKASFQRVIIPETDTNISNETETEQPLFGISI